MNALPSFEPPKHSRPSRKSSVVQQSNRLSADTPATPTTSIQAPLRMRRKSNSVYAHRRQGMEVVTKLITYSGLSIFGIVTLVNSIGHNWSQQAKIQHLETELQDAKIRTEKVNSSFSRSFDPQAQKNVMQENTYRVAPDRLQIFLVNPNKSNPIAVETPPKQTNK
jgi:hypothetical protein